MKNWFLLFSIVLIVAGCAGSGRAPEITCEAARRVVAECDARSLAAEAPVALTTCGQNTPAVALTCQRQGTNICGSIRPGAQQGSTLPLHSDSTQWQSGTTVPRRATGHELFHDVRAVCPETAGECRLLVAYNAGWQLRQLDQPDSARPGPPFRSKDGFEGEFFEFQEIGENDFYLDAIDGVFLPDGTLLVALSGRDTVGISLWQVSPQPNEVVTQLYQDPTRRSRSVALHQEDGTWYAVTAGFQGAFVYDLSAAQATPGCVEGVDVCPGVLVGEVMGSASAFAGARDEASLATAAAAHPDAAAVAGMTVIGTLHASTAEHDGDVYLAAGTSFSLELWRIPSLADPGTASRLHGGVASINARAATVWSDGPRLWLGLVDWNALFRGVKLYDVTHCVASGCSSLGTPVLAQDVSGNPPSILDFLTVSEVEGARWVCYGLEVDLMRGPAREHCWEVSGLPESAIEVGLEGGSYDGSCDGSGPVDYWSDRYPNNQFGLNNYRPRISRLAEINDQVRLYQAAYGVLHAHKVTLPDLPPPPEIFSDDFEEGDPDEWD